MSAPLARVRSVPIVLALLAILLGLQGCRPPYESRYDAVPGPVGTADLVAAALDESTPLTAEEWRAADTALDSYLRAFDELRNSTIAPFVREMRQDQSNRWLADDGELTRMSRRAQSVLGRIRSQDESFYAELAAALPARAALVERVRTRRAIDRALRVSIGRDEGGSGQGFLNLDVELSGALASPSWAPHAATLRPALESMRAAYRQELSTLANSLAEALVEFPSDRLRALRDAAIPDASIDSYVRGGNDSSSNPQQQEALKAAVKRSQSRITRALLAIDDLNARTIDTVVAALPAELGEPLRTDVTFRRTPPEGGQETMRWYMEVFEVLPDVREGRAPKTAAAVKQMRQASDDYAALSLRAWRKRSGASGASDATSESELADRMQKAGERLRIAIEEGTKLSESEFPPETLQKLHSLSRGTLADTRGALEALVGTTQATRLLSRAPRTLFRLDADDPRIDDSRSMALQVLLGPMPNRYEFEKLARAFGAPSADPVMDELWRRYEERSDELTRTQDESLKAQEKIAQSRGERSESDPGAFEREVGVYLRMIIAADEARGQLMNETLASMAAVRGIAPEDPRVKVARAQLAVARSAVPWRRFQLSWLVGPLWLSQADTLALAADVTPEDPATQAAVLAVAVAHAPAIEQAALHARMTGFEALRDFVMLVIQMQREGNHEGMSPDQLPHLPATQTMVRRVRDAANGRSDAQQTFISALEPALGASGVARLRAAYAEQTFPEFFAERATYGDARSLATGMQSRREPATNSAHLASATAHWRDSDAEMMARLLRWQSSATAVAPPLHIADLQRVAMEDGELGALRVIRDENTLRLLRDAAVAAGEPPNARMPDALQTVSRPTLRVSN